MAFKILVNGLLEEDSGKTWITISLYNVLREKGFKVGLYKPISGHDGWRQFNTVLESINRGILVCEDVLKYIRHTDINYPIELINPIDFLLMPTDFTSYRNISEYMISLENQYKQGVFVRISNYEEGFTNHYRIKENYNIIARTLRPWLERLVNIFDPIDISIKQLFSILSTSYLDKILNRNLEELDRENDVILIESFNNVSIPYKEITDYIDRILTITPGYIIRPNANKAKRILRKKLENYLSSEKLISSVDIEYITHIPPERSIDDLSRYLSLNWGRYKKAILG